MSDDAARRTEQVRPGQVSQQVRTGQVCSQQVRSRQPGVRRTRALALALATLTVAGCTGSPSPSGSPTPAAPAASDAATADPVAVPLPDDAAGRQARWVLDQLDPGADPSASAVAERFSAEFTASVPADQVVEILTGLRASAPWTPVGVESGPSAVSVRLASAPGDLQMDLVVDPAGLISGLLFSEPAPPRDAAASWEDLVDEVEGLPARTSFLVASVAPDGACVPQGARRPAPTPTARCRSAPWSSSTCWAPSSTPWAAVT
ncbi:Cpe/LpqF family protein [Cellulomonas sp. ATA003]|uniref:Cpe/LpqF family protein n=1 Tax=Cellulomonas sp. ATA003 TaxID=3073064 RepID=UPI0028732E0D|nr:Cpe/LpqF family protein [Cellulomonas sp. ATA003]WNB85113.1 Cpe/LpqF family protein [Cellulomonas sp. ATA003]